MARGVSPDVAVYSALSIHGAAVGSHQNPRFWLPKADCLHKTFKPCPVIPITKRTPMSDKLMGVRIADCLVLLNVSLAECPSAFLKTRSHGAEAAALHPRAARSTKYAQRNTGVKRIEAAGHNTSEGTGVQIAIGSVADQ